MNNETIVIDEPIYFYLDSEGVKQYTPNYILANSRANYYGTIDVYILK